jgi:hypothetical protein
VTITPTMATSKSAARPEQPPEGKPFKQKYFLYTGWIRTNDNLLTVTFTEWGVYCCN